MPTPKNKIVPGTIVVVDNMGTGMNVPVTLTTTPGGFLSGYLEPIVGSQLEILSGPKKYDGINCVKVRYQNAEFYMYYSQVRYSTYALGAP